MNATNRSETNIYFHLPRWFKPLTVFALVASLATLTNPRCLAEDVHFDVNDVSFLFPIANTRTEAEALIAMDEKPLSGGTIWPTDTFNQVITAAEQIKTEGSNSRINFADPAAFKDPHTWKVVGIRVNPSSLGVTDEAITKFGSAPSIRLIVQPVTINGELAKKHDFAAHVVFFFVQPRADGMRFPMVPDDIAFKALLEDLKQIKALVETAHVPTGEECELNVHPGFKMVPDFGNKLRELVLKHVSANRLSAISFMGLDSPEPWIFFPMRLGATGFAPGESQMLTFRGGPPVTPTETGKVSTSLLFGKQDDDDAVISSLSGPALPGTTDPLLKELKLRDVADRIANPRFHDNLNTDCVSCHTETTRRQDLKLGKSPVGIAYVKPDGISGVSKSVLPKDKWNVRNFGWGLNFFEPNPAKKFSPTISQRAANEAADSAHFINQHYFKQ